MKYHYLLFSLLVFYSAKSQVGIGTLTPSGALDVTSTNNGLLIPRVALTSLNVVLPVITATASELIYNTATAGTGINVVTPGYYYLNTLANGWVRITAESDSSAWKTLGNAGTNVATNFIGTTDAQDLVVKTNNIEAIRITSARDVGIGTSTPASKFAVLPAAGYLSTTIGSMGFGPPFTGLSVQGTNSIGNYSLLGDGTNLYINRPSTGGMYFRINNTDQMLLNDIGRLGIGTTAPAARLSVVENNNTTFAAIASFERVGTGAAGFLGLYSGLSLTDYNSMTNTGDKLMLFTNDNNPSAIAGSGLLIAPWDASATKRGLKIMESGFVGIGIRTPRATFDVTGDAYIADEAFTVGGGFSVGRSATSVFTDNIKPFTDNGLRIYSGNTNTHVRIEPSGYTTIQAYGAGGAAPNAVEVSNTENTLALNPISGSVSVGCISGNPSTFFPSLSNNPAHKLVVEGGYFVTGSYNSDPGMGGTHPGTKFIRGVGSLAVGMNRNPGFSHVDMWNNTDPNQVTASTAVSRGFEFRNYNSAYSEQIITRIDGTGTMFTNGYVALSDKRFKENIVPFTEKVLPKLMKIRSYNYNLFQPVSKDGGNLHKGNMIKENDFGVLVQELYELFPNLVYKPKDENKEAWMVDYSRLSLYVLEGMKEQQKIITTKNTEIDTLKSEVKSLSNKYENLLSRILLLEKK